MTHIHNGTESAQKWTQYDQQTQLKSGVDGKKHVDHGASALENLREAGRNLRHALDPTNHFRDTWRDVGKGNNFAGAGLSRAFAVMMIPWDLAREILDIPLAPFKMAKNLGDAAAHGVMAGIEKVAGRE